MGGVLRWMGQMSEAAKKKAADRKEKRRNGRKRKMAERCVNKSLDMRRWIGLGSRAAASDTLSARTSIRLERESGAPTCRSVVRCGNSSLDTPIG